MRNECVQADILASMKDIESWGRLRQVPHDIVRPAFLDQARALAQRPGGERLCFGLGRSYGDVCLNENGQLVVTDTLDRTITFDRANGIVRAEAGLSLDRLLRITVPHGWFPPVLPGTRFVTLGGAVANDVHGKNHEADGTLGAHVRAVGLARSTGEVLALSPTENAELFNATVGGLGLTGAILWVEIQLKPIHSAMLETETLAMNDLDAFFRLTQESRDWLYKVAWVDCLARGGATGRGLFIRAKHLEAGGLKVHGAPRLGVPFAMPGFLLNGTTIGALNTAYRKRPRALGVRKQHYEPFFFPLDAVAHWNKLYGKRGFYQHQSVVPMAAAPEALRKLLGLTAAFGEGSFLMVLKLFGDKRSPGLLSFPMPGATLALDFPNKGESTRRLLDRMAEIVLAAGGRLYPAKDATMSGEAFRAGYPTWRELEAWRDPAFKSDFWRRVTEGA